MFPAKATEKLAMISDFLQTGFDAKTLFVAAVGRITIYYINHWVVGNVPITAPMHAWLFKLTSATLSLLYLV